MKAFFYLHIILIIFGSVQLSFGQDYEVSGSVIDANSKEPIPFANIAIKDIYKGTASNAVGEFSFKVDSLPMVLVITHLSYEPKEITVTTTVNPLSIELLPGKLLMDEVVIKARGSHQYAYDLVYRAYNRITRDYNKSSYGKAFYRQISKNGDDYSELYEIFYDTRYSLNGIDDWAIQEGRYALKLSTADSFIYNKNFTLMARLLTIVQPKTDDLIVPISEEVGNNYDLRLEQLLFVNNRKVAKIRFIKKEYVKKPAMEGVIFIDVESFHVLKIEGSIVNDDLNFITLKGENGSWKKYQVNCEIAFKPRDDDDLALEYISLSQNFDYYYDGIFANKVETTSLMTFYEYYKPLKRKKLGGRLLRFNTRDSDILDNIGYNQKFWDDNIIVKRTPIEAEVIESFEEERAFGSIYLNNKNQIVLEDYEVDRDPFIINVKDQLSHFEYPQKGEKIYIHHDKPYYVAGENIWFKAYVLEMVGDVRSSNDGAFIVELFSPDGSIVRHGLYHLEDGVGHGKISIPNDLSSGEYLLKAYPRWMKEAGTDMSYEERLEIYSIHDENLVYQRIQLDSVTSLTFYPEGGKLIESMPMQLGLLAQDEFGAGLDIKGRLIGEDGRMVSQIKSELDGYGSIFVMPKTSYTYQPMIMSHEIQEISFPEVESTGYAMMINTLKPNTVDVSIRGTMKLEGDKFYLLVISNGILFDRRIGMLTRGLFKAEFPKSILPNGIAQILLTDEAGNILCKRFVFINQPEEVVVEYYLAKKEFRARERIDMVIELNDENGKSINGANISVSVLDADKISRERNSGNIVSYVNMGYIADNHIVNPGEVFINHDRETLKILDMMVLGQQKSFPEIASLDTLNVNENVTISHENNWYLSGVVTHKANGAPLSNGTVTMVAYPQYSSGFLLLNTDADGRFSLPNRIVPDSTQVLVMAVDGKGNRATIQIKFDEKPHSSESVQLQTVSVEIEDSRIPYLEFHKEQSDQRVVLPEVVKTGFADSYRDIKPYDKPDFLYITKDEQAKEEHLMELFSKRFPGLVVSKKDDRTNIAIRGENGLPLIYLDGIQLLDYGKDLTFNNFEDSILNDLDKITSRLTTIATDNVERIEILKSSPAILVQFGEKAKHGVICIYSMPGRNVALNNGEHGFEEIWLPGYAPSVSFSAPTYSPQASARNARDVRTTLYWNPDVRTNRRGRAKIGFYNSDDARNLQICVEGITDDGIPIFSIFEFGRSKNRARAK